MTCLDHKTLERSSVVANLRMNRERGAVGVNSYEKDLGFSPVQFLRERLETGERQKTDEPVAWLDLCCGRGRALLDAAALLDSPGRAGSVHLHGVDLVDMFDPLPSGANAVHLEAASLHDWNAPRQYDLITCVHGLHYLGDKLAVIERACRALTSDGRFVASVDLDNFRDAEGNSIGLEIKKAWQSEGLAYDRRRHLLVCEGVRKIALGYRFLGADDTAGPNYSGQEAVNSIYAKP